MARARARHRGRSRRRRLLEIDEIVDAALALADAEGLEAVTMRRLADELGVGTMTLYHYLRDKDHLAELVSDRVLSEVLIPGEVPSDWREALSEIARRTRSTFLRHPWILEAFGRQHALTPAGLRHAEQTLAAVRSLESDPDSAAAIVGIVDDYAIGHAAREIARRRWAAAGTAVELTAEARALLDSGEFSEMLSAHAKSGGPDFDRDDFEDGLRWLLDGFEAERVHDRRRRSKRS
jgi:AcrR family transcriptional regulator